MSYVIKGDSSLNELTVYYDAPTHESESDIKRRMAAAAEQAGRKYGGMWSIDSHSSNRTEIRSPISTEVVGYQYVWTIRRY